MGQRSSGWPHGRTGWPDGMRWSDGSEFAISAKPQLNLQGNNMARALLLFGFGFNEPIKEEKDGEC